MVTDVSEGYTAVVFGLIHEDEGIGTEVVAFRPVDLDLISD
jgi:BioD-like phosphotransacetylase family protein